MSSREISPFGSKPKRCVNKNNLHTDNTFTNSPDKGIDARRTAPTKVMRSAYRIIEHTLSPCAFQAASSSLFQGLKTTLGLGMPLSMQLALTSTSQLVIGTPVHRCPWRPSTPTKYGKRSCDASVLNEPQKSKANTKSRSSPLRRLSHHLHKQTYSYLDRADLTSRGVLPFEAHPHFCS